MQAGKINVGKGLLRLYLVLWMLLMIATLVGGHREALTYLGSTYWSAEEVLQRQRDELVRRNNDCKTTECWKPPELEFDYSFIRVGKSVDPKEAKESVELFAMLVLVVPAVLLLVLVVIFRLLAWAFAGFRAS